MASNFFEKFTLIQNEASSYIPINMIYLYRKEKDFTDGGESLVNQSV